MSRTMNIIHEDGTYTKRPMRNCDRCANFADAKGKFRAECDGDGVNFYRRLAEWLMEDAE